MYHICEFCHWKGSMSFGDSYCPNCHEEGFLVPADEWVTPTERPENNQVIYTVVQELNDDAPEIKES